MSLFWVAVSACASDCVPIYTPGPWAAMCIKCLAEGQKYQARMGFKPWPSGQESNVQTTIPRHPHKPWMSLRASRLINITLHPRLLFPWLGQIFPGPATTQKVYQGIEWFSQLTGLQWLTVLSMLIRGITITLTGDWQSSFYHVT